jgi:parallel beta-helix repeat protein
MKRLALALLLPVALGCGVVMVVRLGVQASAGATITVNDTGDTDSRDGVITLRETMLLVTGGLAVGTLDEGECNQVSSSSYNGSCSTTDTIGAASADTVVFNTIVFPSGTPATITLGSSLPTLGTGTDTVDGSTAGVIVDGASGANDCFEITSDANTIKGLEIYNCHEGIAVKGTAKNNTIGGNTSSDRNVVSGNGYGVYLFGGVSGNVVKGNYIGTDRTGTGAVGNGGYGVEIRGGLPNQNNVIGGTAPGEANVIASNFLGGVLVQDGTGNTIRGNSIHHNGGKGIENIDGGNTELAPPIIDSVGGSVSGHTNPKCYPCTVEIFSDDEDEGRIYHGSTITNDDATVTWTYPGAVTGPNITATVTDADGNTSEFSAPVALIQPVGGIAQLPDSPGSSAPNYIALAALAAAALAALTAGAWYARRRWLR